LLEKDLSLSESYLKFCNAGEKNIDSMVSLS
jgi:hypothetical protein